MKSYKILYNLIPAFANFQLTLQRNYPTLPILLTEWITELSQEMETHTHAHNIHMHTAIMHLEVKNTMNTQMD